MLWQSNGPETYGRIDMERYTYFDGGKWRLKIGDTEYSGDWVERLAAYEETGLEPEELAQAQAKKKGRLVVLPCDVGDKLYDVTLGEVREKIVISLSMLLSKSVNHLVIHAENFRNAVTSYELQDIGKTVFLTREAAEAALKEREAIQNVLDKQDKG